jgi:uncharacterized Fe-S cluster-containing radical SAM superfamily protein
MLMTDHLSAKYRTALIDPVSHRLLITNFIGTEQERDLTEPPNCDGFGRIRHFRRGEGAGWPLNPLPIDPACQSLSLAPTDILRAQVFQNAACNWRCWYCFVPFNLLAANPKHTGWLTPVQMVDYYLAQPDRPRVIDLTGGQPDLTPEWVVWMMDELVARGLDDQVYLWSDDNLSTDYLWRYLTDQQRERLAAYPHYGRVGCFKGFDSTSFTFNTRAEPEQFPYQLTLMGRLLDLDVDLYAYATFTTPQATGIADAMARFVESLQQLDENLPLRTVPLQILPFTPVQGRLTAPMEQALVNQHAAIEAWQTELQRRFPAEARDWPITHVPLRGRRQAHGPAFRSV